MFHQVFICDTTEEPECSRSVIAEQNSVSNATPQTLKQESITSGNTTMGYIPADNFKMSVDELKLEQFNVINNQLAMKTDSQVTQEDIETKNSLNVMMPSCSNIGSPMPMVCVIQPPQIVVSQPLGQTYVYQPSAENIVLQPQPTLIKMNEDMSALPVLLQTGAVVDPVTGLGQQPAQHTQNPAMKIEPLINVMDISSSVTAPKPEQNYMTSSQVKKEEPMEDGLHQDIADSGVTEVPIGAVIFQDSVSKKRYRNSNLWHKVGRLEIETKEATGLIPAVTDRLTKVQHIKSNPKSQNNDTSESRSISDKALKLMYNIKECSVLIEKIISKDKSPKTVQDSNVENEFDLAFKEYEDSSFSDREEELTDIDYSSGSDWEEEYLGKKLNIKIREKLKKETSRTTVDTVRNIINHPIQKNSESLECSSEERNNIYKTPISASKFKLSSPTSNISLQNELGISLTSSVSISRNDTSGSSLSISPHVSSNHSPSQIHTTKNILRNKTAKTSDRIKLKSTNKNMTLNLILQNKITSIADSQNDPNTQIEAHMITVTETKPIEDNQNPTKSVKKLCSTKWGKSIHKNNIIFPQTVKNNNKNSVQRTTPKQILPKTRGDPSGSQTGEVVEMLEVTKPLSDVERMSSGDFDDVNGVDNDESSSKNELILPRVPYYIHKCNKCNRQYEESDKYLWHMKYSVCSGYKRELRHQCDICGNRFTSREKMEAHLNSHSNARPFKCFDCDKHFNSKVARQMHHKNMHLNKKTLYLCYFCGYVTISSEHIVVHEESHRLPEGAEMPKPFKCSVCDKGFMSRWKQQRHKKEHRLKKCGKCSEKFKTDAKLRNHMEAAHSIRKYYKCKECGNQFRSADILREHRTFFHSSKLSFFCDICDKGFKRRGNLTQHMITHSDDRPISCPECGDSFKRITHLKQHTAAFHGDGRKK